MTKTEAFSIRRGLSIYKQPVEPGRGSPNWYARVHMQLGDRATHVRSTKTTDAKLAKERAEAYWAELAILRQSGGSPVKRLNRSRDPEDASFDHVAERWLENRRIEAGSDPRGIRRWQDDRSAYLAQNGLAKFFGHKDVNDITTDDIREFMRFQVERSAKAQLASSTQARTLVTLRQILKSAFERRLLKTLPLMPRVRVKDQPRSWFTEVEVRLLVKTALTQAKLARAKRDRGEAKRWMEIADFVLFMVSTFLRPSEWKMIRHSDVTAHPDGPNPHIEIRLQHGKTGSRTVLSMPEAVRVYRRMRARSEGGEDNFLFKVEWSNRATAAERMADAFGQLLRLAGLGRDGSGRNRVIYGLRHSAIMFRLLAGVDVFLVAKAAGTSVGQIERFYGSHLQVTMRLQNLQGQPASQKDRHNRFAGFT